MYSGLNFSSVRILFLMWRHGTLVLQLRRSIYSKCSSDPPLLLLSSPVCRSVAMLNLNFFINYTFEIHILREWQTFSRVGFWKLVDVSHSSYIVIQLHSSKRTVSLGSLKSYKLKIKNSNSLYMSICSY